MPLPKRPERSAPVPNQPFSSPEVTSIKGPYWDMALGSGLETDGQGSVQTTGSTPSEPSAMLYGPGGFVGLGSGLQLGADGSIEQSGGGYIYCTPQFSNLPVTYPPYNCETEVNTEGVTDFTDAWWRCSGIANFPCVDSSSVTNFSRAWCVTDVENFPSIDTSSGEDFYYSWNYSNLTSFPKINTSKGIVFSGTWGYCYNLSGTFPKLDWSNARGFDYTWYLSGSEAETPLKFPTGIFVSLRQDFANFGRSFEYCNLTEESVDNILASLDESGSQFGTISMDNCGSMPSQSVIGINVFNLWVKGWDVRLNDGSTGLPPTNYGCSTSVDTSGRTSLFDAWKSCDLTTNFPILDVSSCKIFQGAWSGSNTLTEFPILDTGNGVNFKRAWEDQNNLVSFPELDTSNGVDFSYSWVRCISLISFPLLDVSSGVNFTGSWGQCINLQSFPPIDFSKGLYFNFAWYGCTGLTSFPLLDVSRGISFNGAWTDCTSLTAFPLLDVSQGTDFYAAWYNCSSLTSFPQLDISSGTNFDSAWYSCTSLTTFPAGMFNNCLAIDFFNAWENCALTQQSVNNILVSLDIAGQINGLVSINGGTSSAPGAAGLAAKASLQARGWTVTTN